LLPRLEAQSLLLRQAQLEDALAAAKGQKGSNN
jgi:hypothetical protein